MHSVLPALLLATAQAVPFTLDRLELDLRVDHENERVEGTARLVVRNVSDTPAADVPVLLNRLMVVTGAGGLPFSQQVLTFEDDSRLRVDAVTIRLPEPIAPGASRTVALAYGGHIASYEETGRLYVKDRVSEDYTIVREDAYSFPVLGVPSLARDRSIRRDGFTFDAQVTVARGFAVAAGGFAGRAESATGTTYRFSSRDKVPFLNLCIARFRTLAGKGFTVSYLPGDEAEARKIGLRTEEALALLTKWFGPPPEAPDLALVEIPSGWGSQADRISGIILTADSFHDPTRLYELYHELAHLWNPPDLDRPSPRWNEGLSMWLQQVIAENLEGLNASSERAVAGVLDSPDERLKSVPFASYGTQGMTDASYGVGRLYFLVLERVVGRDAKAAAKTLGDSSGWMAQSAMVRDYRALKVGRRRRTVLCSTSWGEKALNPDSVSRYRRRGSP